MKIDHEKGKTKEVKAQQISRGNCFWYKESYYMAVTPIEPYPLFVCAVNLGSGQAILIGNSVRVIPVYARVVVEE